MKTQSRTLAELAVDRVLDRAAEQPSDRPGQHTIVLGGRSTERRHILDRIETLLRERWPELPIGRVREPHEKPTPDAAALWDETANAAGLDEQSEGHTSGLGRIQTAAGESRFVAIIDDLDTVLDGWNDPGEALNLRWALQNVDGLLVIAGNERPITGERWHEHAILSMTFATQSL